MSEPETWRHVVGFPGYSVSSTGRVRSTRPLRGRPAERELRATPDRAGYGRVFLRREGRRWTRTVHQLVAEAFHGPRPAGMDIRHLDGDKTNNAASNLRYGSRSENELDKVRHGTHQNARKTHCPARHPYSPENTYVSPRGERDCRTCRRDRREAASLRAAGIEVAA